MPRRITAIVGLFVAASSFAQVPPEEQPLLEIPALEASEVQDLRAVDPRDVAVQATQASPLEPRVEREIEVLARPTAPGRVQTLANLNGSNGDLVFDSPSPPFNTGVWLRAHTITPDIFAQLGTNTSASSFQVVGSNEVWLFKVRGDGYAILRRDQDTTTALEINNANPGTASSSSSRALRLSEGGSLKAYIASTGSGSTSAIGGANAMQVWNHANGPIVFGTSSNDRMRIYASGKVSIGHGSSPEPVEKLSVRENANAITTAVVTNPFVGDTAAGVLQVTSDVGVASLFAHSSARTISRFGRVLGGFTELVNTAGNGAIVGTTLNKPLILGTNSASRIFVEGDGDVGIGTDVPSAKLHVDGNVIVTNGNITALGGVIGAVYQDLAEWVPASVDMEPGTVVVLNHDRTNEVMPSHTAYDTGVAGVVSAQPGVLLGIAGDSKEQIATTGRVKVRVDATRAPIRVGDLLVTSDVPGSAMRSEPMDINGRRFHQPGTIIGKALEPIESGVGEILVLLSLQ